MELQTKIDESLKNEFICIRINQLPKLEILKFIKNMAVQENIEIEESTINKIQHLFKSDIRSMINYIQLNENILRGKEGVYMNDDILEQIHALILNPTINSKIFVTFIRKVSINFNIDERSIIQKYINHLIVNYPSISNSSFIQSIEIIIHRHDIPLSVHILYLFNQIRTCM